LERRVLPGLLLGLLSGGKSGGADIARRACAYVHHIGCDVGRGLADRGALLQTDIIGGALAGLD
jgi:hypothetical protein